LEDSYLNRFKAPTDYWHGRGFTDNAIEYFSLGYDVFSDRGTIPYRDIHGRLLGVIYRRFDDGFPKYRYPAGFPRKFSLFNSWSIASMEPPYDVAIVEGSLDAAKCWQADVPAVAQYGSSITPEQVVLLHRIGVQSVTLFYDNDPAGFSATIKALQMLKEFHVRIVNYPSNWPSDPGAMSTKQIRKCYRSAQAFHV
jgi:DNA primase